MDAPVLPPSQEDIPAVMVAAADHPQPSLADPGVHPIETAQLLSSEPFSPRTSWFVSSQLSRSFSFLGNAFKSARLGTTLGQVQYSAALPIQWNRNTSWKSWATPADIQVEPIEASAEMAASENGDWSEAYVPQCLLKAQRELKAGPAYRISLRDKTLGYVADAERADLLTQQLRQLIRQTSFDADTIAPRAAEKDSLDEANVLHINADGRSLFSIDDAMAEDLGYSKEWAAVAWANNLRVSLEAEPMSVGMAHSSLKNLEESDIDIKGDASWYGPYFHGRATANGETYNQHDLTVAHKSLPFGTQLKVRNVLNDKTVVVRVNDRGPYVGDRSLDLSNAAAKCLGSDDIGVIPYEAVILKNAKSSR